MLVALYYNHANVMPQTCRKYVATLVPADEISQMNSRSIRMTVRAMKISSRAIGMITALGLAGFSLAGCVYYPSGYGYASPGYYAPAYAFAPPVGVVVGGGWGWGGGWGHGGRGWR